MTLLSEDAIARGLEAAGVPPEKARAEAKRQHAAELQPDDVAQMDAAAARRADVLEKAEQSVIRKMAIAVGCTVYNLSQSRATKQTPGIADLWIAHQARSLAFWWETKRQVGGARSSAQEDFARECLAAGIPYGFGDRYHFAEFLTSRGITPPAIPSN